MSQVKENPQISQITQISQISRKLQAYQSGRGTGILACHPLIILHCALFTTSPKPAAIAGCHQFHQSAELVMVSHEFLHEFLNQDKIEQERGLPSA